MYSRFQERLAGQIRIPENYSGCAFSPSAERQRDLPLQMSEHAPPRATPKKDSPEKALSQEKPASAVASIRDPAPSPSLSADGSAEEHSPSPIAPARSLLSFSNGIGFDELLLLGVILLLLENGEDSEMIPYLALLLFCR